MPDSFSDIPVNTSGRPPLAGWMGGKSLLAKRIIERMPEHTCYMEPFAGAAWVLFRMPYGEIISRYDGPGTFFYIDPPYWDCENYYGPGIFSREDFTRLATQIANIKGKFILSLNDMPGVREVFKAFDIEAMQTKYTCSNGKNMPAGEVLITN